MSAIWRVEEDGIEVTSLVSPSNIYYLLEGDRLLMPHWEIGYCVDCSTYTWIENLTIDDAGVAEINKTGIEELRRYNDALKDFFATRVEPPRCLFCNGANVASMAMFSSEGINPVTRKRCRVELVGAGCFLDTPPLFLSPDGKRLTVASDRAEALATRGRGRFLA